MFVALVGGHISGNDALGGLNQLLEELPEFALSAALEVCEDGAHLLFFPDAVLGLVEQDVGLLEKIGRQLKQVLSPFFVGLEFG